MVRRSTSRINAGECAERAGKYAFGLDKEKTATALRRLADEIETGSVALHSFSTSSYATQDEFAVREVVIEILEESQEGGPQIVRD